MAVDREIVELSRAIARARRAVVFTGAGISTESGIPDFRSPGGIWTRMAPIDFSDFLASEEARRETWPRPRTAVTAPSRNWSAAAPLLL
jgi:NAD-dependent deacetylase